MSASVVKTLSCGLKDSAGSNPDRGNFFPFSQTPKLLACKIRLDEPLPGEDITLAYLLKQFPYPCYERTDLSHTWIYGRIFETTSGYHGEFFTPENRLLSLIHLGNNELEAIRMMRRITQQHMYILSLMDCQ